MIESLACFSVEKLVLDAEWIASAQRLIRGMEAGAGPLATAMFAQIGLSGEFLQLKETRALFRQEQHIPSPVIDRSARGTGPPGDVLTRARARVDELVGQYRKPSLPEGVLRKFQAIVDRETERAGAAAQAAEKTGR